MPAKRVHDDADRRMTKRRERQQQPPVRERTDEAALDLPRLVGNKAFATLVSRSPLHRQAEAPAGAEAAEAAAGDITATADKAQMTVANVGTFSASLQFSGVTNVSVQKRGDEHSQKLYDLSKARKPIASVEIEISQGDKSATWKLIDVALTDFTISGSFGEPDSSESFRLEARSSERVS